MKDPIEFEQVTTRGGDAGDSSLYNGERRDKGDVVFDCLGDLDETVSWIGVVKSLSGDERVNDELTQIQAVLFRIGAMVATPAHDLRYRDLHHVDQHDLSRLEQWERGRLGQTAIEPVFVLPGATQLSAFTDVARTVTRRLERNLVRIIRARGMTHLAVCQQYSNRLSDYLFVLARASEQRDTA